MQKQTIKLFLKYSSNQKVPRALALLFTVFAVTTNTIVAPYVLSLFMNRLQAGDVTLAGSGGLIALYAALLFLGEVVLWRLVLYFLWRFEVKSQRDLYLAIFNKLSHEDTNFHASRFGGSLVSQSTKMISAFERFWDMLVWSVTPLVTVIIGTMISLTIIGMWQFAIFIAIFTIIFALAVWLGTRFIAVRNTTEAQKSTKTNGFLADMVTNVATVKAFAGEKHEHKLATKHIDDWKGASFHLRNGILVTSSVFSSLIAVINIAAFVFAVYAAEHKLATAGTVYLVLVYSLNVSRQLWEMNRIARDYNRVVGDAHDMTQILTTPYSLVDHTTKKLRVTKGQFEFDDVSFTHDNGKGEQVFDGFSLTIPGGQRVGIVGRSGSGKTTMTRIMLRLSDIDSGKITIDGQDISQVTQASLRQNIAYVAQEPILFHRSLAENIAYGKPNATRAEITEAAKQAYAWEFIEKLPDGLDTLVGERGVKLSGGQRQRIAIARAILKDAPILVLDEATSALDSESEKLIQASFGNLMSGRTSIVIAHRLSTIAKLDRIIVIDSGTIVEDGSFDELLQKNGIFAGLWKRQGGGFIES